jgi:hypothetical protein
LQQSNCGTGQQQMQKKKKKTKQHMQATKLATWTERVNVIVHKDVMLCKREEEMEEEEQQRMQV